MPPLPPTSACDDVPPLCSLPLLSPLAWVGYKWPASKVAK
jgi:hypothetical protein